LFFKFVQCDLNLTYFGQKHEIFLRDYYIKSYVNNSPSNILVPEVDKMILYFNKYCLWVTLFILPDVYQAENKFS